MGRRSGVETVVELVGAFVDRKRWRQAELARRLEMTVPALRKHLVLLTKHIPLTSTTEHPDVFWQVSPEWKPEGLVLRGSDGAAILRLLARAPRSVERDRLLTLLLQKDSRLARPMRVDPPEVSPEDERHLAVVEDAASRLVPLKMKYSSAHRGGTEWRVVSVARIMPGPPSRFLAVCHRAGKLRAFRVSSIHAAHLDGEESFREADTAELERRVGSSVGGFFDGADGEETFVVRGPKVRWVAHNLPDGVRGAVLADGSFRASASSAGLPVVAGFVVALGDAAVCESVGLANAVKELAEGAVRAGGAKYLNGRSAVRIRAKR